MKIPLFSRGGNREIDPVCDMQVATRKPPGGTFEYNGQTYYLFCPGAGLQPRLPKGTGSLPVRRQEDSDVAWHLPGLRPRSAGGDRR